MSDHAADAAVPEVDESRRKFLIAATAGTGAVGAVLTAVPFVASWKPSESARAAGLPTEVDLSKMEPGQMTTHFWRKKQIYVVKRTPEMLAAIKKVDGEVADPQSERTAFPTPEYARNEFRSRKPEFLIAVGICTHLGCNPVGPFGSGQNAQLGADQGFLCPCHGSTFDLAGRVFKNKPAPDNLVVPPHKYLSETVVLIGDDSAA